MPSEPREPTTTVGQELVNGSTADGIRRFGRGYTLAQYVVAIEEEAAARTSVAGEGPDLREAYIAALVTAWEQAHWVAAQTGREATGIVSNIEERFKAFVPDWQEASAEAARRAPMDAASPSPAADPWKCPRCGAVSSHDHCVECGAKDAMPWTHEPSCSHYRPATEFDTPEARAFLASQSAGEGPSDHDMELVLAVALARVGAKRLGWKFATTGEFAAALWSEIKKEMRRGG